MCICIYVYEVGRGHAEGSEGGDDAVGNPRRAQIARFELFELVLLWKLDKQFPVERFEASRTIRGSSISVSSALPPLLKASVDFMAYSIRLVGIQFLVVAILLAGCAVHGGEAQKPIPVKATRVGMGFYFEYLGG